MEVEPAEVQQMPPRPHQLLDGDPDARALQAEELLRAERRRVAQKDAELIALRRAFRKFELRLEQQALDAYEEKWRIIALESAVGRVDCGGKTQEQPCKEQIAAMGEELRTMAARVAALEKQLRQAETVATEYGVLLRTRDAEVVDIQRQLTEELAKRKDLQYALIRSERALLEEHGSVGESEGVTEPKLATREHAGTPRAVGHAKPCALATPMTSPMTSPRGQFRHGGGPAPIERKPADAVRGESFSASAVSHRVAAWEAAGRSPQGAHRRMSGPTARATPRQLAARCAPAAAVAPAPAPASCPPSPLAVQTPRMVLVRPLPVVLGASAAAKVSPREDSAAKRPLRWEGA